MKCKHTENEVIIKIFRQLQEGRDFVFTQSFLFVFLGQIISYQTVTISAYYVFYNFE